MKSEVKSVISICQKISNASYQTRPKLIKPCVAPTPTPKDTDRSNWFRHGQHWQRYPVHRSAVTRLRAPTFSGDPDVMNPRERGEPPCTQGSVAGLRVCRSVSLGVGVGAPHASPKSVSSRAREGLRFYKFTPGTGTGFHRSGHASKSYWPIRPAVAPVGPPSSLRCCSRLEAVRLGSSRGFS